MRRALGISFATLSAVFLAVGPTACGGDDDSAGGGGDGVEILDGTLGEPADIGDITVTVDAIRFDEAIEDDGTVNAARVAVDVRTENTSDEEQDPVDFNIFCANSDESGGWYDDSTYVPTEPIPAGETLEGELFLGVPGDCDDPTIHASNTGIVEADAGPSHVAYPLPADVVDQITA